MLKTISMRSRVLIASIGLSSLLASAAQAQPPVPPQGPGSEAPAPPTAPRDTPMSGMPAPRLEGNWMPDRVGQPMPTPGDSAIVANGDSLFVLRGDILYRLRASNLSIVAQRAVPRPALMLGQREMMPPPVEPSNQNAPGAPLPPNAPQPEVNPTVPPVPGVEPAPLERSAPPQAQAPALPPATAVDPAVAPAPPVGATPDGRPTIQEVPPPPADAPPMPQPGRRANRRGMRDMRPRPGGMPVETRGMPEMPAAPQAPGSAMSVSGNTVYLMRGNMVYRFRTSDLKLLDQRELTVPMPTTPNAAPLGVRQQDNGAVPLVPAQPGDPNRR